MRYHLEALAGPWPGGELAATQAHPLAHAENAMPGAVGAGSMRLPDGCSICWPGAVPAAG